FGGVCCESWDSPPILSSVNSDMNVILRWRWALPSQVDRLANIKLQLDVVDRSHDETAELAAKVYRISQTL
ncbi:hypothetical protein, partial [uncultured Gimesia sp.]|uniref:hypothetical protein n=1 Tax=uncultured Gimesia sp. TaxID=1678688 RepID=UPI0030D86B76